MEWRRNADIWRSAAIRRSAAAAAAAGDILRNPPPPTGWSGAPGFWGCRPSFVKYGLADELRERIEKYLPRPLRPVFILKNSELGGEAAVIGAASLGQEMCKR